MAASVLCGEDALIMIDGCFYLVLPIEKRTRNFVAEVEQGKLVVNVCLIAIACI